MKAKDVVCIDTHILIWGVKRQAEPDQQQLNERAEHFLEKCKSDGTRIILPSLVLGEVLAGTPPADAGVLAKAVEKRFMVVPFDALAATEFAKMWHQWKEKNPDGRAVPQGQLRQKFKVDKMIPATAVARRAWCLYTHDSDMKRLANGLIEIKELPEAPPRQRTLL